MSSEFKIVIPSIVPLQPWFSRYFGVGVGGALLGMPLQSINVQDFLGQLINCVGLFDSFYVFLDLSFVNLKEKTSSEVLNLILSIC